MEVNLNDANNLYRAVAGTLPRKRDVQVWSNDRFMDFFRFISFFMEDDKVTVTLKKRKSIEDEMLQNPTHPWSEFMWRINCFTSNKVATDRKFYYRLSATMRLIGAHIKSNPSLLTDEMKALVEPNPRLNWIIPHFKTVTTKIGAEVLVPDTQETVGFVKGTTKPANPEVSYMESIFKAANVFDMIVSSIKKSEINNMTTKDKINSLSKLSFVFSQAKNMRPNSNTFKQINIYNAKKEELESAILDFSQIDNNEEK